MIDKTSARKTEEVPESAKKPKSAESDRPPKVCVSAKKPKSAESGQPLKRSDDAPSPSSQKPELAIQKADQSGKITRKRDLTDPYLSNKGLAS